MKKVSAPQWVPDAHPINNRSYFFDRGIYFKCIRCGQCCVGEPGLVRVFKAEISTLSQFLSISKEMFISSYLHLYQEAYAIREHADGRCFFYENGCRVYPVRPLQCRTFPFWMKVFRSEESFNQIKKTCPGIGRGRFFSKADILDLLVAF